MKHQPAGFIVVRSPLLPIDDFVRCSSDIEWCDEVVATSPDKRWQAEFEQRGRDLRAIFDSPLIRQALSLSSSGFLHRLETLDASITDPRVRRGYISLSRYFARLCSNPVPFGISAGTSVGYVDDTSSLHLAERTHYRCHNRLTVRVLERLIAQLLDNEVIRDAIGWGLNSTLAELADRYHFQQQSPENELECGSVAIEGTPLLKPLLEKVTGDITMPELRSLLVSLKGNIAEADAQRLLDELVQQRLLIPGISPAVCGNGPLEQLIEDLTSLPAAEREAEACRLLQSALSSMDGLLPTPAEAVSIFTDRLTDTIPGSTSFEACETSLQKPAVNISLSRDLLGEVLQSVDWLRQWLGGEALDDPLQDFRAAFANRYGSREVPLLEALDLEVGLGRIIASDQLQPGSLASGIEAAPGKDSAETPLSNLPEAQQQLLQDRLTEAITRGHTEIAMSAVDLLQVSAGEAKPLPAAFVVKGALAAESDKALNDGHYRFFLQGTSGPAAMHILSRQAHGHSALLAAITDFSATVSTMVGDAIIAEVIYAPDGGTADSQIRPRLSEYEIPCLGRSTRPANHQIALRDLLLSIHDDCLVLRCSRLGKRVLAQLNTPHDYRHDANTVFRFLGLLQQEGTSAQLRWKWGNLASVPFLPRVTLGRTVLSPARWHLNRTQLSRVGAQKCSGRFAAMTALREQVNLPRFVYLVDGEHRLLCDLANIISVESFVADSANKDGVYLEEVFPAFDELAVRSSEGRFVHDLVIPFAGSVDHSLASPGIDASAAQAPDTALEWVEPGEWLYFKLYGGPANSDRSLTRVIAPLLRNIDDGVVRQWHFLRYSDPDPHLRIRFHGNSDDLQALLSGLLTRASHWLLTHKFAWKVELAVYEPELERYGGIDGMSLAERIFHHESDAALLMIAAAAGEADDLRWQLTMKSIDQLLDDLSIELSERAKLLNHLRLSLGKDFAAEHRDNKRQVAAGYRRWRKTIQHLLNNRSQQTQLPDSVLKALSHRSSMLKPIGTDLARLEQRGGLTCRQEDFLAAILHMHCNRLLRWPGRVQEWLIYDYLSRHYASELAKSG